ncbi:LacI family DNA-binding transcriptional regulator [Coraliomargarita parva]|uniref:LacI family DNA-binding transcriptional regulator n=1 Tax=Coraliomargarita parva TaxID=3014050 RepID=UPI0022B326EC|nr:LacI family DNA-binding transcriptional regulator [Coraliomargarita parva]
MRITTIKDIAEELGVHHSTVSRALAGNSRISEATRTKVLEVAERLGYRSHPLLSALGSYRRNATPGEGSTTIAYITNWPGGKASGYNWGQGEYFPAAAEQAERMGYRLQEFSLTLNDMTPGRLSQLLQARGVPGVIIQDSPYTRSEDLEGFDFNAFACAVIGYSFKASDLPRVVHSPFASIQTALKKIADRGFRRPVLLLDAWQDERVDHQWHDGFIPECQRLGMSGHFLLLRQREDLKGQVDEILDQYQPDLVITYANNDILKAVDAYYQKSDDATPPFALLNMGSTPDHPYGINQHLDVVGRKAVDVVVSQLLRRERGRLHEPVVIQVVGTWKGA